MLIEAQIFGAKELSDRLFKMRDVVKREVKFTLDQVGAESVRVSKSEFLSGPRPDKLGRITSDLFNSVWFRTTMTGIEGETGIGTFLRKLPYARIHELGGETKPRVTKRSRRFFWAKFAETGDPKWKWMALTEKAQFRVKIRARPYLSTARKRMHESGKIKMALNMLKERLIRAAG